MAQKEALLNTAILRFAVESCIEGDYASLQEIGVTPEDVSLLESVCLEDLHHLAEISKSFVSVRVDSSKLRLVLEHLKKERCAKRIRHELMLADAPQPLMEHFFGMTSSGYTAYRKFLGMSVRIGRPSEPTECDELRIWNAFKCCEKLVTELDAKDYLAITHASCLPLRSIWRVVKRWTDEGIDSNFDAAVSVSSANMRIRLV